jgi:hypothetical protein
VPLMLRARVSRAQCRFSGRVGKGNPEPIAANRVSIRLATEVRRLVMAQLGVLCSRLAPYNTLAVQCCRAEFS